MKGEASETQNPEKGDTGDGKGREGQTEIALTILVWCGFKKASGAVLTFKSIAKQTVSIYHSIIIPSWSALKRLRRR